MENTTFYTYEKKINEVEEGKICKWERMRGGEREIKAGCKRDRDRDRDRKTGSGRETERKRETKIG